MNDGTMNAKDLPKPTPVKHRPQLSREAEAVRRMLKGGPAAPGADVQDRMGRRLAGRSWKRDD